MTLARLSVVVPNYNHGAYLPECLGAISRQSVPAHEVIVIDDGSTDNSVDVIERMASQFERLRFYRNETNRGVIYTVNRGVDLSTGDLVCILAADDQVMPGFFEKSIKLLAANQRAGLSGTICRFVNEASGLRHHLGLDVTDAPCYLTPEEVVRLGRQNRLLVFTSTLVYRREALLSVGKQHADLRWHADWFSFVAVAIRHGMCFIPEVLGEFRVRPASFSNKGMRQRKEQVQVLRRILERLAAREYEDVAALVREGALLAPFGKEMLGILVSKKCYWCYLTPVYLRWAFWWMLRIEAKKLLPRWVARLYYRLGGYNPKHLQVSAR